ncbi:hypothetical protein HYU17_01425 [Candidatus Woesearchaeota archaeon]|nr:hypothetical protein [Candidatus Woesearchaeota archaeon]
MGVFGMLGKVLPWRRKDELGIKDDLGFGMPGQQGMGGLDMGLGATPGAQGAQFGQQGMGGMPQQQQYAQQPFGFGGGMGMPQQAQPPQMESFQASQMEVVSAKLDAIRSALEALNQRLAAVERYMQVEQDFKKRGGW